MESLPKPKHVEEKFEPTTNKHDWYVENLGSDDGLFISGGFKFVFEFNQK